jgi:hypothetical protein
MHRALASGAQRVGQRRHRKAPVLDLSEDPAACERAHDAVQQWRPCVGQRSELLDAQRALGEQISDTELGSHTDHAGHLKADDHLDQAPTGSGLLRTAWQSGIPVRRWARRSCARALAHQTATLGNPRCSAVTAESRSLSATLLTGSAPLASAARTRTRRLGRQSSPPAMATSRLLSPGLRVSASSRHCSRSARQTRLSSQAATALRGASTAARALARNDHRAARSWTRTACSSAPRRTRTTPTSASAGRGAARRSLSSGG